MRHERRHRIELAERHQHHVVHFFRLQRQCGEIHLTTHDEDLVHLIVEIRSLAQHSLLPRRSDMNELARFDA